MTKKILEVRNLKQHFSSGWGRRKIVVKAVDGISFDIYEGETFGLVGESGCGKTTTGRTIIKLNDNTEGEVLYNGKTVSLGLEDVKRKIKELKCELKDKEVEYKNSNDIDIAKDIERINAQISKLKNINKMDRKFLIEVQMIFQDPIASLNPRMTIKEIIGEGLEVLGVKNLIIEDGYDYKGFKSCCIDRKYKLQKSLLKLLSFTKLSYIDKKIEEISTKQKIKAEKEVDSLTEDQYVEKRVFDILETVGLLPEHANRYPHEFSGGQRQRIGIARALIMKPKLIIADEPISALDVSIQASVINLLKDLQEKLGLTILFIAHDLSVVKYFSDRIAVMYPGKIVEMASSDELFKNPLHPYTKSLLSAVPIPDPDYERTRKRQSYDSSIHNYDEEKPKVVEIKEGHFIYASKKEVEEYKKQLT